MFDGWEIVFTCRKGRVISRHIWFFLGQALATYLALFSKSKVCTSIRLMSRYLILFQREKMGKEAGLWVFLSVVACAGYEV